MEVRHDRPITSLSEPGIKAEGKLLHDMRREVSSLLGRHQTGFPGAQPVSFSRKHLTDLLEKDFFVCEKSDGIRYLLYSTEDEAGAETHYLIDRKNDYWFIPNRNLHFPLENDHQRFHTGTIMDGELVFDTLPNGVKEPRFLIFDCLTLDGHSMLDRTLDKRIAHAKDRVFLPYKKLFDEFPEERQYQPFFISLKHFQVAYGVEQIINNELPTLLHGNDGLIFTHKNTPYKPGTDPNILKWKPPEENTIDCRLKLNFPLVEPTPEERSEGIDEPFIDYDSVPKSELLVYAGGKGPDAYEPFDDVVITQEEWETLKAIGDPLQDRVVECYLDDHGNWRINRFRDDKEEANHKSTIFSVLDSIRNPVTLADLLKNTNKIRENWKDRQHRVDGPPDSGKPRPK